MTVANLLSFTLLRFASVFALRSFGKLETKTKCAGAPQAARLRRRRAANGATGAILRLQPADLFDMHACDDGDDGAGDGGGGCRFPLWCSGW